MNAKSVAGFLMLIAVAGAVYFFQMQEAPSGEAPGSQAPGTQASTASEESTPAAGSYDPVTIQGYVGGEKMGFLRNPKVGEILQSRYGVTFDARKAGSIEMVTTLSTEGQDLLWRGHYRHRPQHGRSNVG